MNTIRLNSGKYLYFVTYKKKSGLPRNNFELPVNRFISEKIRTTNRTYFDHRDQLVKEIIYPQDLWFTEVLEHDPVETYLNDCIEFIPDWVKIEIKNNAEE